MDAIWTNSTQRPNYGAQQKDRNTDVLIIGGGLAGILCAAMLNAAGVDNILVEADCICSGITGNTTAKITVQHGLIYDKLIRTVGVDRARKYWEANRLALEKYRELSQAIDCDFEEKDAFVYSRTDRRKIEAELEAYRKLGAEAAFVTNLPLPFPVAGAVRVARQAQFHPLKFAYGIAKGLRIMEHTKVREIMPKQAITDHGTIRAKKIIVATHFPFLNKHGSYFLKLYQHRSYVLALRNAPDVNGMYLDESDTGLSFRNYGNLLLLGGGGHRPCRAVRTLAARSNTTSRSIRGTAPATVPGLPETDSSSTIPPQGIEEYNGFIFVNHEKGMGCCILQHPIGFRDQKIGGSYSVLQKQTIRFASANPSFSWKNRLVWLVSSQSLANSKQPRSFAQASHAASSALAMPRLRYSSRTNIPSR